MAITPDGKNRIMIFGPKNNATYVVEFKTASGETLSISIPRTETAVIRHFQERMPYGLFVTKCAVIQEIRRRWRLIIQEWGSPVCQIPGDLKSSLCELLHTGMAPREITDLTKGTWCAAMHELFISYCRHDSDVANALADTLSKAGLSVWLDRKAIQEGDAFDTQIEEAIAQTRVVIVIWSEHSVKSHWVRVEAAYALGKHKLLPISIDQSEPPLQFMQIQTIDFRYWDRTSNQRAFQQLAAALAKRLEASAVSTGVAQPRSLSHALAALSADAVEHPAKTRLEAWIAAAGLRFPETVVEREYQDYFCEKTFIVAQFAMLLAAATYVVYGAADMAMESGGVLSTRFRFMIALPLMATFFALSFKPFARRHSQAFIIAFGVVAMACTYINVYLIAAESPFRINNGNATMNAMLMLGFLALLPLSVGSTIMLGSIVVAVHAGVVMQAGMLLWTSWLFYLHVSSMFTVACCIAYWRERFYRTTFAAEFS